MKRVTLMLALIVIGGHLLAQPKSDDSPLVLVKAAPYTTVKNQSATGTCWSFSTTSLVESELLRTEGDEFDLSEMYTVRNIYTEKAKNYILRQGAAQFGAGGLGHDVIHSIAKYGAIPESVYSGLPLGAKGHDHFEMDRKLKEYLDQVLARRPIDSQWMKGFESILDDYLGKVPETFQYKEKLYTPAAFAREVLAFQKDDYIFFTSFTHHPFYQKFALEVPDNYRSESYWNIPLSELLKVARSAVEKGYSVMWDADVSNSNFRQDDGLALQLKDPTVKVVDVESEEEVATAEIRQQRFEDLTTQDDHLMHIVGIERSQSGKNFFLVKNSWGEVGPFKGMIHVSENYFAFNTITIVVPKKAIDSSLLSQLNLN